FKCAWKECDDPHLYGWLLSKLATENDYYRLAMLSAISQMLYEFHRDKDDRIEKLTELLDRISEGSRKKAKARHLGNDIVNSFEPNEKEETAEELIWGAKSLMESNTYFDESYLESIPKKEWNRACQIIRTMVERPTLKEIESYQNSFTW
ncbi:unnamed protein product, partial [marine sediment metagenome]